MKTIAQLSIVIGLLLSIHQLECSNNWQNIWNNSAQSTDPKNDSSKGCDELLQAFKATEDAWERTNDGGCLGGIRPRKSLPEKKLNECTDFYNKNNTNKKINTVMFPDGAVFLFKNKE